MVTRRWDKTCGNGGTGRVAIILAKWILGDRNETVGSFHNEISKIHLKLARWVLFRWQTMKAIGYNSAVINLWWRKWFSENVTNNFGVFHCGFSQAVSCDSHLHFEPTIIPNGYLWESLLPNWNKKKKIKKKKKHENLNEIKGSASPDSQCDDTLLDLIWKGLNVLKCKWLDAWKPKWEARFYMGQRQEDYRTEINRGKKEGAILMWIV